MVLVATSSILHDIVIDNKEDAVSLVRALEEAERVANLRNYNAVQDLKENYDKYKDLYDENIKYINESGGQNLSMEDKYILIAGFLGNMHETLSEVSSNLCNLSKSGYEAQVYIDNIREYQERLHYGYIKSDIEFYLKMKDETDAEKLELIEEYINSFED